MQLIGLGWNVELDKVQYTITTITKGGIEATDVGGKRLNWGLSSFERFLTNGSYVS